MRLVGPRLFSVVGRIDYRADPLIWRCSLWAIEFGKHDSDSLLQCQGVLGTDRVDQEAYIARWGCSDVK